MVMNYTTAASTLLVMISLFACATEMEEMQIVNDDPSLYEGVPIVYQRDDRSAFPNLQNMGQENQVSNEPEIDQQERRRVSQWEYRWCPTPYYDDECDCNYCWNCDDHCCTRGCTSTIAGGATAFCGLIKLIHWCAASSSKTCPEACSTKECNSVWFPTECSYIGDGVSSTISWVPSLSFMGAGLAGLCTWAPWWDDRGCNLRRRVQMDRNNNN